MFQLPKLGPAARGLMIGLAVLWLLHAFLMETSWAGLVAALQLRPADLLRGWLWQPFTALLLHPTGSLGALIFPLLFLWFYAAPYEERVGPKRMLLAFFATGLTGNIAASAATLLGSALLSSPPAALDAAHPLMGASSAVLGVTAAYLGLQRGQILQLAIFGRVKAASLAAGLIGVSAAFAATGGESSPFAHLAAGGLGWWLGARSAAPGPSRPPKARPRPKLQVLEGGNPDPSPSRGRGWGAARRDPDQWH